MRAGLLDKLGLGAAALRASKPSLIWCNLSAFGAKGPLVSRPGYDPLMQAFAGIMSITGEDGRPAIRVAPSIIDQGAGMWAVIGILAALHRRAATGEGCVVDTSLFETALSWMNSSTAGYLATGRVPGRHGSEQPSLAPYKVYRAADGEIMVACGNDNLFKRLAGALAHPEWIGDPRFASNGDRVVNREALNVAIEDVLQTRTVDHWLAVLEAVDVPVTRLQTVDQVAAHPQTEALGMLQPTPDGVMQLMGVPLSFDGERPPLERAPPALGAAHRHYHNQDQHMTETDDLPTMAIGRDFPEIRDAVQVICRNYPGSYWRRLEDEGSYATQFVRELTDFGLSIRARARGVWRLRHAAARRGRHSGGGACRRLRRRDLPRPDVHDEDDPAPWQRGTEAQVPARRLPGARSAFSRSA